MQTRRLGKTDLELTVIGLGTWAIGGGGWAFGWGEQDDDQSIATIHEALEHGVNWIDTAAVYGYGHSEEVVGRALKEWPEPVIVATKGGRLPNPNGRPIPCIKRESLIRECEDSLRRLHVEVIDLYQLHWPQPDEDIEEAIEALADLKTQGKIRWAGVSNFSANQLDRAIACGEVASLQPPYSLLNRDMEARELPWCAAHRVGVIVYSPMQCGLLTGKVTREWFETLPEDDWRKTKNPYFQEPALSRNLELVSELQAIAERSRRTVAQLAIAWTLRKEAVTAAIVGARRPGQITGILPAAEWKLGASLLEEISKLLPE